MELPTAATLENILKHTKLAFIAALKQLHHTDRIAPKKTQLGKTCEIHSFKIPYKTSSTPIPNLSQLPQFMTRYTALHMHSISLSSTSSSELPWTETRTQELE